MSLQKRFKLMTMLLAIAVLLSNLSFAYAYNRSAAISYADQYAKNHNSAYLSYGADCTNYTSQCLRAGGYSFVNTWLPRWSGDAWWYDNKGTADTSDDVATYTWTSAANQYSFINYNWGYVASTYVAPSDPYPSGVSAGDLFYYDWENNSSIDHSAIYVANGTDQEFGYYTGALQNQHTNDHYHVIWTLYPYNAHFSTTKIYCMHMS